MGELEVIRVRDEVFQHVLDALRSDLDQPTAKELSRFLAVPDSLLVPFLERFVADLLLEGDSTSFYWLSPADMEAGRRTFAAETADLTRPTHGECDADCWCHDSPEAAAGCLHEGTGKAHGT